MEADLAFILEDDSTGFGWPIGLTSPSGALTQLVGYSTDIGQAIDPDTGMAIAGRTAEVTLRISSLPGEIPTNESDTTKKPWLVSFESVNGVSSTFKVIDTMPDHVLGVVVLALGEYTNG